VNVAKNADLAICRVLGVPPVLIGAKEGGGMSDAGAKTDLLLYAMNTIGHPARLISEIVSQRLCPIFGPDIVAELDTSGMLAMQEAKLDQAKGLVALTGRPILTADEARTQLEYDPLPNKTGDEIVIPFNVVYAKDLASDTRVQPGAPGDKAAAPAPGDATASSKAARLSASDGDPKATLRYQRDADLQRYERRVAAFARSHFNRQEAKALDRAGALSATRIAKFTTDPHTFVPEDDSTDEAQRMFEAIILDRAEAAAAEVGAEVALNIFQRRVQGLVADRAAQFIKNIDDTTRAKLAEILPDLIDGGASPDDIARAVRQVFSGRRDNALTIARTETAWAYNLASKEAWTEAGVAFKSWLTANDDAVRESHQLCESTGVIPMDQNFPNGLLYPGDPTGSAGEVINCRCILQPEFESAKVAARRNGNGKPQGRPIAEVMGWGR
jgi:hypothetical protein